MNTEITPRRKEGAELPEPGLVWRYRTREGREVELIQLRAAPMPGFVTGTRKDTGEEWTVAVGKLHQVNPKLETPNAEPKTATVSNSEN